MTTPQVLQFSRLLRLSFAACWGLVFSVAIAQAQLETEPHPLDTFLKSVLNFSEPTGIRGTLRYIEKDQQTLWLNWEQRSDERPLFATGWTLVPGEPTLAVQPRDSAQWEKLLELPKGLALELIIQDDGKGNRHILSYQDLSGPRKVPL